MSRRRSHYCGNCGTLKIILHNGASRCLVCHNRRGREYYQNSLVRRWKQRKSYILRKYGVSIEFVEKLLARQQGRCAVCAKLWQECGTARSGVGDSFFMQYLFIDHCHRSGKVRGLLCNACNTALGLLQDDPVAIQRAYSYLNIFLAES